MQTHNEKLEAGLSWRCNAVTDVDSTQQNTRLEKQCNRNCEQANRHHTTIRRTSRDPTDRREVANASCLSPGSSSTSSMNAPCR